MCRTAASCILSRVWHGCRDFFRVWQDHVRRPYHGPVRATECRRPGLSLAVQRDRRNLSTRRTKAAGYRRISLEHQFAGGASGAWRRSTGLSRSSPNWRARHEHPSIAAGRSSRPEPACQVWTSPPLQLLPPSHIVIPDLKVDAAVRELGTNARACPRYPVGGRRRVVPPKCPARSGGQ